MTFLEAKIEVGHKIADLASLFVAPIFLCEHFHTANLSVPVDFHLLECKRLLPDHNFAGLR